MQTETPWKRLLALEVSAFGFFELFWGCFAVQLADLSGALFVGAGASIVAMAALGWASDRGVLQSTSNREVRRQLEPSREATRGSALIGALLEPSHGRPAEVEYGDVPVVRVQPKF